MNWITCLPFLVGCLSIPLDAIQPIDNYVEGTLDYVPINRNFTSPPHRRAKRAASTGPAVVELVIVTDKEFGDIFQQDYFKILNYLTAFLWDVNMRYKTLLNTDISFRLNGLLTQTTKESQPFIENSRRSSDGKLVFGDALESFSKWMYARRDWLLKFDMALLITNTPAERLGGLANFGGACYQDAANGKDFGTVVITDSGAFTGVPAAAHEMAHNLKAPHDDEVDCPYGFIMSGDLGQDGDSRYFFSKCTDAAISAFINSPNGDCLKRYDGYETTPMDRNFSTPKAGPMLDMCRASLGPTTSIDESSTSNYCKNVQCIYNGHDLPRVPVENIQCGNSGRCFRGKCRPESKLLKNEASGFCMNTDNRLFGYMVPARMFQCPSAKDKTPLETIEIKTAQSGQKLLATPFLYNDNQESGDRCFWTGQNEGDMLWTDRCGSNTNPWHYWDLKTIDGNPDRFQLVHSVTGRCARVMSNASDSYIYSTQCGTDSSMVWSWTDGV
ncbi:A disintegrin and metalloproteinase with thrombospondin motifs 9-like [Bradysia coprophila]|uniref:A disintegrin and metalloproteinase with thrombospondin motifs 9-like n=1 Tax=Bradysia coprophila TaxID=38358 RepID=UPI00187D7706|nr:A disintegrin and metalloproteinase with thrombospondin motifs 9-like [Bradysia coprophila]XP_037033580.1 A disintegrin and metalloproteinase with thrombospondin motifs 9-like [Bradysia coprophila]